MQKVGFLFLLLFLGICISCNRDDPPSPEPEKFTGSGAFSCMINGASFDAGKCGSTLATFETENFIGVRGSECADRWVSMTLRSNGEKLTSGVFQIIALPTELEINPRGGGVW